MLRRLYDWTLFLAESPHELWAPAVFSFDGSSVFPTLPDVLLTPTVIAAGLFGLLIDWQPFEQAGRPTPTFHEMDAKFGEFSAAFNADGVWAAPITGITSLPDKVVTIIPVAAGLNFAIFVVARAVARGFRFLLAAVLLWRSGAPIRSFAVPGAIH